MDSVFDVVKRKVAIAVKVSIYVTLYGDGYPFLRQVRRIAPSRVRFDFLSSEVHPIPGDFEGAEGEP